TGRRRMPRPHRSIGAFPASAPWKKSKLASSRPSSNQVQGKTGMEIKGKVFIVTGGASGLGAGTVRMLVDNGAKVVIADVQDDVGSQLTEELGQAFVHCDVTSEEDGRAAVARATA